MGYYPIIQHRNMRAGASWWTRFAIGPRRDPVFIRIARHELDRMRGSYFGITLPSAYNIIDYIGKRRG